MLAPYCTIFIHSWDGINFDHMYLFHLQITPLCFVASSWFTSLKMRSDSNQNFPLFFSAFLLLAHFQVRLVKITLPPRTNNKFVQFDWKSTKVKYVDNKSRYCIITYKQEGLNPLKMQCSSFYHILCYLRKESFHLLSLFAFIKARNLIQMWDGRWYK